MYEKPDDDSQRIFSDGLFQDQVAVITGGGSGIGLKTAEEFLRLGANVAICGRTEEKLVKAKAALEAEFGEGRVFAQPCDIREPEQISNFVSETLKTFKKIHILVNNAGGQFPSPAQLISPNGFRAVVQNNLNGTFFFTREVANQAMIPQKKGRIINIIANIYRGFPGMVHTGAARAGVENMTMTLAVEWSRMGILVNAIAPGIITSTGTKQYPPAIVEQATKNVPLKRAGTVAEVTASILFLASPAAQYITGATLRIDGAQSLFGETWMLPD